MFRNYLTITWRSLLKSRTEQAWWIYAATGFVLLLVTVFTMGFQVIKAAMANPVVNLKYE